MEKIPPWITQRPGRRACIGGHKLTVIAADLMPIAPYQTDSVILTSGQRYDVIFEGCQDIYWIRVNACNKFSIDRNDITAIIRYQGASQVGPTTKQRSSVTDFCTDGPYTSLVPSKDR